MEPKLGKMLILGVIFNCLDPILSVVAGLSVRDPFLAPLDKKDVRNIHRLTIVLLYDMLYAQSSKGPSTSPSPFNFNFICILSYKDVYLSPNVFWFISHSGV